MGACLDGGFEEERGSYSVMAASEKEFSVSTFLHQDHSIYLTGLTHFFPS